MDGHQECSGLTAAHQIGPSSRLFHTAVSDKLALGAPEAAELRTCGARKEFFLPRQAPEGGLKIRGGRGLHCYLYRTQKILRFFGHFPEDQISTMLKIY